MKKILSIFIITTLFSGELEVEGDLTVTGNISSPSIEALSGMKPDRIYRYQRFELDSFNFTVPQNKIWVITFLGTHITIDFNGLELSVKHSNSSQDYLLALPGDSFGNNIHSDNPFVMNVYEYSISGSGTDHGMDYVEP